MSDTLPVSMLKTRAVKNEVANYRRMGLKDDELGFVMDSGAEVIVVNKTGLVKLMKSAPVGTLEALRRLQGMRLVDFDGSAGDDPATIGDMLSLDDELELFRDGG